MAVHVAVRSSSKFHRHKRIKLREGEDECARAIEAHYGMSPIVSGILAARGYRVGPALDSFLHPTLKSGLPFPNQLKGLEAACGLLNDTIRARVPIAVACDFDVDGLSGGSQLYALLRNVGNDVHLFVPDRFKDGYGLNLSMVDEAHRRGCGLLVTIDFGTKNAKELQYAASLGMRSIVIDHHHVGASDVPVDIFINPQQSDCGFANRLLSASGLVWYLIAGMKKYIEDLHSFDPRDYLDLACLGTICDMVPLQGANRVLAKKGLDHLAKTPRKGLKKLLELVGSKGTPGTYEVAFGIGPRVNAAGRMLHGGIVVELFTTDDSLRAAELAHKLNDLNARRQKEERGVLKNAMERVSRAEELSEGISVWSPDFHTGVLGIVAQRLVEQFHRPSAVMGMDEPGVYKGSVRGVPGMSVISVLEQISDILLKYGGHEGAAGFAVPEEMVQEFQSRFAAACASAIDPQSACPLVTADTEVQLDGLTYQLLKELELFSPCGVGNKRPVLLTRKLVVERVQTLKDAHLRVTFSDGKRSLEGLFWKCVQHPAIYPRAVVNIAYKPELNTFSGTTKIQAQLEAVELY